MGPYEDMDKLANAIHAAIELYATPLTNKEACSCILTCVMEFLESRGETQNSADKLVTASAKFCNDWWFNS